MSNRDLRMLVRKIALVNFQKQGLSLRRRQNGTFKVMLRKSCPRHDLTVCAMRVMQRRVLTALFIRNTGFKSAKIINDFEGIALECKLSYPCARFMLRCAHS